MTKKYSDNPNDYIEPFYINGLDGHVLNAATRTTKKNQIFYVYDIFDSLESSWGLIDNLRSYGNVCCVDLPGMGGMNSYRSIDYSISIDSYADYLAAFIKLRYKRHKIIIVGSGFGFVAITRMLIKYPALSTKIKIVVNIAGNIHHDDYTLGLRSKKLLRTLTSVLSVTPLSQIAALILSNKVLYKFIKTKINDNLKIFSLETNEDLIGTNFKKMDKPSYFKILSELCLLDNCVKRIDVPLKHVYFKDNKLINDTTQKQHMIIAYKNYKRYEIIKSEISSDNPRKTQAYLLPKGVRRVLSNAKA